MSILDSRLSVRSAYLRKLFSYSLLLKTAHRRLYWLSNEESRNWPIVVNSIPKSGTHLLLQVVRSLPGTSYYGQLVASMPSLTLRERSSSRILQRVALSLPREVIGGHIHYSPELAFELKLKRVPIYFAVRNLFDVFESEIHYIRELSKHHRMHYEYRQLQSDAECARLAFIGSSKTAHYAGFIERISRYVGWAQTEGVYVAQYERLIGDDARATWLDVFEHHCAFLNENMDRELFLERCAGLISSSKSHTFTNRDKGRYLQHLSRAQTLKIDELNRKFGYS